MGLSESLASALLSKHGWSVNVAQEMFLNDPDHVENLFKFRLGEQIAINSESVCPCCFCQEDGYIRIDDCGHFMCVDCYKGYLTQKVGEGVESVLTVCPDDKCNMIVPECLFKQLLN